MTTNKSLYTGHGQPSNCSCPIHEHGEPHTVPLGVPFSQQVTVEEINAEVAEAIYEAHHSYMADLPNVNICHHGIYFRGQLMGAISYRQPLISRLKLSVLPNGSLTREHSKGVDSIMVNGGTIVEVNRICIGVDMKNLASCGLAHSQEKFLADHADRVGVDWLLTFIRNDHVGSMLRALNDKGWNLVGYSEPREPGNRETEDIHSWKKQRWLYPHCEYQSRIDAEITAPTPASAD